MSIPDNIQVVRQQFNQAEAKLSKICALKPSASPNREKAAIPAEMRQDLAQAIQMVKEAKQELLGHITSIKDSAVKLKEARNDQEIAVINKRLAALQKMQQVAAKALRELAQVSPKQAKELNQTATDLEVNLRTAIKAARKEAYVRPANYAEREQAFIQKIDFKAIAQLIGDAFIKDLKDRAGDSVEGYTFSSMIDFVLAAIDYLPAESPQEFPADKMQQFSEIAAILKKSKGLIAQLEELFEDADEADFPQKAAAVAHQVNGSIQSLKSGEIMLIPWGWRSREVSGHAMLAEFKKEGEQVLIQVYNTGSGLVDHELGDSAGKPYANTVKNYRVPLVDLEKKNLISRMLEPRMVSGREGVTEYSARELYHMLEPYAIPASEDSNWMKIQLSGTCTVRCLMAFLRHRVGTEDYKIFKNLFERKALQALLEKRPELARSDPKLFRTLVSRAIANLYRQELKRGQLTGVEKERLGELKKFQKSYRALCSKVSSKRPPVAIEQPKTGQNLAEAVKLEKKDKLRKRPEAPKPLSIDWLNNYNVSPAEISKALKDLHDHIMEEAKAQNWDKSHALRMEKYNSLMQGIVMQMGRLFTNPALQKEKQKFQEALRQSGPQACTELLENMEKITQLLVELRTEKTPAASLALASSTVAVYQIGGIMDDLAGFKKEERMDFYSFGLPDLSAMIAPGHCGLQLVNPQWQEDLKNLVNYHRAHFPNRDKDIGELPKKYWKDDKYMFPDRASPDYRYWTAHAKRRKDWKDVDIYYDHCKSYYRGTKEHFRIVNGFSEYPRQYHALMTALNRTIQVSSFHTPIKSLGLANNTFDARHVSGTCHDRIGDAVLAFGDVVSDIHKPAEEFKKSFAEKLNKEWVRQEEVKHLARDLLDPKMQNEVVTTFDRSLHELMSIVSEKTPLQFSMLIDCFRKSPNQLIKPENQLLFSSILCSPLMLGEALAKNPGLKNEFLSFFQDLSEYYRQPSLPITSKEKLIVDTFLISQKQFLLLQLAQMGDAEAEKAVREQRREILNRMEGVKDPETQLLLNICYVNSFLREKSINREEATRLVQSRMMINKLELIGAPKNLLRQDLKFAGNDAIRDHLPEIFQALKADGDQIIAPILREFNLDPARYGKWNIDAPPVAYSQGPEGVVEVDILAGTVKTNGRDILFGKPSKQIMQTPVYQRLFGNKPLNVFQTPDFLAAKDDLSPIRIVEQWDDEDQPLECLRMFDNQDWYAYRPIEKVPSLSRLPFFAKLDVWINTNPNGPVRARLYDNKTRKLEYQIFADGTIEMASQGNKRFELLNSKEVQAIKEFAPDALLLREKESGKVMMLLPHNLDEHGEPLIFDLKRERQADNRTRDIWSMRTDPDLIISSKQEIKGIDGYDRFLMLENSEGEQLALIPQISFGSIDQGGFPCMQMQLKNHHIGIQKTSAKTLFSAYLHLSHAATSEDYVRALDLIESVREYRRFNDEELKILGLIYDLSSNANPRKADNTPESYALRLLLVSLVRENFAKYPQFDQKRLKIDLKMDFATAQSGEDIERIWCGLVSLPLSTMGEENLSLSIARNIEGYLERRNNLPHRFRLEQLLSSQQLHEMRFEEAVRGAQERYRNLSSQKPGKFEVKLTDLREMMPLKQIENRTPEECLKRLPILRTRRMNETGDFQILYRLAESPVEAHRNAVKEIVHQRMYDTGKGQSHDALLLVTVLSQEKGSPFQNKAAEIVSILKKVPHDPQIATTSPFVRAYNSLEALLEQYNRSLAGEAKPAPPAVISLEPAALPVTLPDRPRSTDFGYTPLKNLFGDFDSLHQRYFEKVPVAIDMGEPPFKLIGAEKRGRFIQESVAALNRDYEAGREANLKRKGVVPKGDPKQVALDIITKELPTMRNANTKAKKELEDKEKEILKAANRYLRKEPQLEAEVGGGKRSKVTMDDCMLLFLQKDSQQMQKITGIASLGEQQKLYQKIGDYLELSAKTIQQVKVLSELSKVNDVLNKPEKLGEALVNLANVLSETHLPIKSVSPEAVLVFESKVGLILRDYQVEGLNAMLEHPGNDPLRYADIFLQRIQAGGKTLVWGHLLAHLKADGYHLSIHISPTHQYASNLYDMGDRSHYVFSQKEHTMIFDDHPSYYTPQYLKKTLQTLQESIKNREYINTTKRSLDTLLAQYDRLSLSLSSGELDKKSSKDIEDAIPIMQDILSLLRSRGVFTFDEVHQALEPSMLLNIPLGTPQHPDYLQCQLSAQMLKLAMQSKDADGRKLLQLKENRQSQQTESDKEKMLQTIAHGICRDPNWRIIFGIQQGDVVQAAGVNEQRLKEVEDFLLHPSSSMPAFLKQLKEQPGNQNRLVATDYVLLARQLLAGEWLPLALSKGVNEFHGINRLPGEIPVSIPFVANMVPAYGSEFSDQYVKMLNTQIAYLVDGPSIDQIKRLIQLLRQDAVGEYEERVKADPSFTINDTRAVMRYQLLCKETGLDQLFEKENIPFQLFDIDQDNVVAMERLQKALKEENEIASDLLLEYVNGDVLSKVDIFNHQVSINGQNTALMAKHINGYTASIDNPNMAPVMGTELDSKGKLANRVTIQPQIGTNGQTIDLLLRQNNEVWVVPAGPKTLFTHLINLLPEEQKTHVRTIKDEGCHFRGIGNHAVAKMIVENLPDKKIKAVLFFDQASGKLCYIRRENPDRVIFLKGTRSISEETHLQPKELFTYYDQEHITGTDIVQMDNAIGISTMNENSRLPNELQQVRRLRKLDFSQRTITAVQAGSLDKISHALQDPAIRAMQPGKVASPEFIKKLLLFTHLNEAQKQRSDNLEFAFQQMESIVQQYLRDGVFQGRFKRSDVYGKAKDLFRKDIASNLAREHAKNKIEISNADYFKVVREGLLQLAKPVLSPAEHDHIGKVLLALEKEALPGIQEKIQVNPDYTSGPAGGPVGRAANRNAVVLQRQVNIQRDIHVNVNIRRNIERQAKPEGVVRQESPWTQETLKKPGPESVQFLPLATQLSRDTKRSYSFLDPRLLVTDNFLSSLQGDQRDLANKRRKPIFQVGLIQNAKGEWNVIMGSVKDMWKFAELINTPKALPQGSKAWLIRPQGQLAWPGPFPFSQDELLKNRQVVPLLVQTLLFGGHFHILQDPFWGKALEEWVKQLRPEQKKELDEFVRKIVYLDKPPAFLPETPIGKLIAVGA